MAAARRGGQGPASKLLLLSLCLSTTSLLAARPIINTHIPNPAFATIRPPRWTRGHATLPTVGLAFHTHSTARDAPIRSETPPPTAPTAPLVAKTLAVRGGGLPILSALDPAVVRASFGAVGELLVCCMIGAAATRRGILDKTVLGSLSKVVYNMLLPSLLLVNVSRTVYSKSLWSLLPLPMFALVQVFLCGLIARAVNFVLGVDPDSLKGREISVCCTFGNAGVLPILFSTVLLRNDPDPTALPLAVSYVSFYLLGWTPIFWTLGYSKLAGPKPKTDGAAEVKPRLGLKESLVAFVKDPPPAVKRIMSPPVIGSLGGLCLGISPLARLFLGKGAPLSIVTNGFETIGRAYSPTALLVLAGSLASQSPKVETAPGATQKKEISTLTQAVAVSMVRFFICPAIFLSLVVTAMRKGFVALDRLMLFVLFIQSCMPSAQNTVIIHSIEGRQEAATNLARSLLWIYMASCFPISALLTYFLQYFM